MLHEAIFLGTCLATSVARQVARKISRVTPQFCNLQRQQNVALRVARKLEISLTFRNVARQVALCDISIATCNAILWKLGNQSPSFARRRFQAGGERQTISSGSIASCEEILRTCDTLSATCNVFHSSSLRDKLQEKLPRVTWPFMFISVTD